MHDRHELWNEKEHTFFETLAEDPETLNCLDAKVGDLAFHVGGFPFGMHEDSFVEFVQKYDLCHFHYVDRIESCQSFSFTI